MSSPRLSLLLVEQQFLVRSTVIAVARQIDLARIDEATTIEAAEQRLARQRYDGLLLSLDETAGALDLLSRLRAGEFEALPSTPVVVMTASCSAELAEQVKRHAVRRLLLKPFKVKTLLQSIESLGRQPAENVTA